MYYILCDKVGVKIDDNYIRKWGDFDLSVIADECSYEKFKKTTSKLYLMVTNKHNLDNCMQSENYYYNSIKFIDMKLGVSIIKKSDVNFGIYATRHCPEWFSLMIEIVLLKSNLTIVHAAAMEKNNISLFMPARGGVGKTATVVNMIRKHNWRLLGDDLVILDGNDGTINSYLKRFVIYGYHKDLFPEVFKSKKAPIKNNNLSKMVSHFIPIIKKGLMPFPRALDYARNHNPQQMKILPKDIFENNQLSSKADKIGQTIWLERVASKEIKCFACKPEEIASRSTAITLGELTYGTMNLNLCLIIMCGCGFFDFKEIYTRMYKIIFTCIKDSPASILEIPEGVHVTRISEMVNKYMNI